MRIFRTLDAAQTLLGREELAVLTEDGRRSFVYRDDTNAVLLLGGDMSYRGAWSGTRDYRMGDLVTHGGTGYVAKERMTASSPVQPGVTGGWASFWDALAPE